MPKRLVWSSFIIRLDDYSLSTSESSAKDEHNLDGFHYLPHLCVYFNVFLCTITKLLFYLCSRTTGKKLGDCT
jgi:hypothetical protein